MATPEDHRNRVLRRKENAAMTLLSRSCELAEAKAAVQSLGKMKTRMLV